MMWSFACGSQKAKLIVSYWQGSPPSWRTKRPPDPKPKKVKVKKKKAKK